jgi:diguanylate cyclase (GGDEF)-like protein
MRIIEYFSRQSRLSYITVITACIALISIIGYIDYITGKEISISLFYLIPVSIATWFINRWIGFLFAIIAGIVWFTADTASGQMYSHPFIPYWNATVRLGFFFTVSVLLSKLKNAFTREKELSRIDSLTGMLNRRAFYELARLEIERNRRFKRPFSVAYIDLDNFKTVNDLLGHSTGDTLLCLVSNVMKDNIRATDITARVGGDEFVILLPETDGKSALLVLNKIKDLVTEAIQKNDWPVTLSIGAATFINPPEAVHTMMQQIDNLMYRAKNNAKDRIVHEVSETER